MFLEGVLPLFRESAASFGGKPCASFLIGPVFPRAVAAPFFDSLLAASAGLASFSSLVCVPYGLGFCLFPSGLAGIFRLLGRCLLCPAAICPVCLAPFPSGVHLSGGNAAAFRRLPSPPPRPVNPLYLIIYAGKSPSLRAEREKSSQKSLPSPAARGWKRFDYRSKKV